MHVQIWIQMTVRVWMTAHPTQILMMKRHLPNREPSGLRLRHL